MERSFQDFDNCVTQSNMVPKQNDCRHLISTIAQDFFSNNHNNIINNFCEKKNNKNGNPIMKAAEDTYIVKTARYIWCN